MYYDEVLWQKKMRIQKEMWYQKERNKEISVLKKTKSLSCILEKIQQELDVLTTLVDAQQASKREEQKHCNDDRRKRRVTFIQSCWR
jgi:glycogen synthase